MAYADRDSIDPRERYGGAVIVVLLHAAALYGLIAALGLAMGDVAGKAGERLIAFALDEPVVPIADSDEAAEEGASSKAAEKADPTPVLAPEPKIEMPTENDIVAAPDPMAGDAADAGAAEPDQGAGSGDGGEGTGTGDSGFGSGAGGSGDGTGAGTSRPIKIAGEISPKDYRKATGFSPHPGAVTVFFTVRTDGSVTDCRVERASASPERDALTCRLIEQRFRYKPARGADGEAVATRTGWRQRWWPDPKQPNPRTVERDFGPR